MEYETDIYPQSTEDSHEYLRENSYEFKRLKKQNQLLIDSNNDLLDKISKYERRIEDYMKRFSAMNEIIKNQKNEIVRLNDELVKVWAGE